MSEAYDEARDGTGSGAHGAAGTGDAAVDQALTLLAPLVDRPLREHVEVFDAIHTALQDRLADTEG
ncbi:hypothetical protein ACGIF2_00020 [Cellulomonas sp. P22]|uniref:hypothetical protein n=1 Tax=Cellulomonas sp. P22 TaxID=3373189 RepID=UPI0037A3ACD5